MKMKTFNISLITIAAAALLLTSCQKKDKNSPGYEFMGKFDMYRSPAYKAYENNPYFSNGLTMQGHVDGTIPHSFDREKMVNYMPFPYANTPAARDSAKLYLRNPLQKTEDNLKMGEYNYNIYCAACHGKKGDGDGPVVGLLEKRNNMQLKPTPEQLKTATEGQIFYTTQYGKNNMGPYAAQLSAHERWQVVMYVQTLGGAAADSSASSTPKDTLK